MEMERKNREKTFIQNNLIWEITKIRTVNRDMCREKVATGMSKKQRKIKVQEKEN